MEGLRNSARRKAEKKMDSIYANEKEVDKFLDGDNPKERTEGGERKCKTCSKQKENCMACELCEEWVCQDCTEHGITERKKIKKASEKFGKVGILWTCLECNEVCKKVKEKEGGGCGKCEIKSMEDMTDFYMSCDFCRKWLCETCLGKKEGLNRKECNSIMNATNKPKDGSISLQLIWACHECRSSEAFNNFNKDKTEGHETPEEEDLKNGEEGINKNADKEIRDEHIEDKDKENKKEAEEKNEERKEGESKIENMEEEAKESGKAVKDEGGKEDTDDKDKEKNEERKEGISEIKNMEEEAKESGKAVTDEGGKEDTDDKDKEKGKKADEKNEEKEEGEAEIESMEEEDKEGGKEEMDERGKEGKDEDEVRQNIKNIAENKKLKEEISKKENLIKKLTEDWAEITKELEKKEKYIKEICKVAADLADDKERANIENEIYLKGVKREYKEKRTIMETIREKIKDKKAGKEEANIESLEQTLDDMEVREGGLKNDSNPMNEKIAEAGEEQEKEESNIRVLKEFTSANESVIKHYLKQNGNMLSATVLAIIEDREQQEEAEKKRNSEKVVKGKKECEERVRRLMEATMVEEETAKKYLEDYKGLDKAALAILKDKLAEKRKVNTEAKEKMQDNGNCTKCQTECKKCGISVCTKCVKSGREKEKRECPRCKEMEKERERKTDGRDKFSFKVCEFYLQGRCRFGNFCRNKHTTQTRRTNHCKYYEQNRCRFGNRCRNLHQRQKQEDETRTMSRERKTEEALEEGLLREDAEGKLTCKCCETKVVSWRQHSVSEKHQRNEKYEQEKHNEEKKRKEKEEEKESQEITIEEALLKGIIKVDENRRIACVICKTQVVGWIQHRRSEQHKKEENKQKEETDKEVERLEKCIYSFEPQPESGEEGTKRVESFLQQVKSQLKQM